MGLFDPPNPRAERFGHVFSLDASFAQLYYGELLPPRVRSMVLRRVGPKNCA
jgi:hypothetical protein